MQWVPCLPKIKLLIVGENSISSHFFWPLLDVMGQMCDTIDFTAIRKKSLMGEMHQRRKVRKFSDTFG